MEPEIAGRFFGRYALFEALGLKAPAPINLDEVSDQGYAAEE